MFLPISTDTNIRRVPWVNYGLIALNVLIYTVQHMFGVSDYDLNAFGRFFKSGMLDASNPRLYEFFTHQFLHADAWHLGGNMLFLWVFGNSVNGKMGNVSYLLFYLAGGVAAAAGYAWTNDHLMLGASGAISAVTTAYLAMFPRSYVKILYWWFIIGTFELPSMILIVVKVIIWDNLFAMYMMGDSNVAHGAHLAGYTFGFISIAIMLTLRWLPRDQFDIIALWRRWWQRQSLQAAPQVPTQQTRFRLSRVARPVQLDDVKVSSAVPGPPDRVTELRFGITDALGEHKLEEAATLFCELLELDPRQVLPRLQQVEIANLLYKNGRLPQAVAAYEKYLVHYPTADDKDQIRLLLGIIYARDLHQHELAEAHLRHSLDQLTDAKRIEQCRHWLRVACEALGRPFPQI